MRLIEFASAEEQLGLWRIISDKVWAELKALSLQQTQAAQQAAIMQTGARAKRATGAVKPTKPAKPTRPSKPANPAKPAKPAKPVKPQKAPTAPPKLSPPSKTPKAPLKRPSRALSIRDKLTSPPIATRSAGVRAPLGKSELTKVVPKHSGLDLFALCGSSPQVCALCKHLGCGVKPR